MDCLHVLQTIRAAMLEKSWFLSYLKDLFLLWFCSVVVCTVTHSPNEWKCPDLVLRGVWCKNLPNQKCRLNCSGDPWWIWEQLKVVVWMSLGKLQRLGVYHTKTKKHFKLESPVNQRSLSVDCMRGNPRVQSLHQWHPLHQQHRDTWDSSLHWQSQSIHFLNCLFNCGWHRVQCVPFRPMIPSKPWTG